MPQYKVPQNIDLEDKVVGPFTIKQFAYLMGGGLLIYAIYQMLMPYENGTLYTILIGLPIAILAMALTFVKINDRPFEHFILNLFQYMFSPKKRIWHRGYITPTMVIKTPVRQKASTATEAQKHATLDEIATHLDLSAGNTGPTGAAAGPAPAAAGGANSQAPGVLGYTPPAVAIGEQATAAAGTPAQPQTTTPPPPAPKRSGLLGKVFDIVRK